MKKQIEIGIVLLLIMTIASTNFFLLGSHIALAAQNSSDNINNIYFDSYFYKDEQKNHTIETEIDVEQRLFIDINVKDRGYIENGKIEIEDPNFVILKDKVKNQFIKNINIEKNEIELNQIVYGDNITIEIPISFKRKNNFTDDYFSKENRVLLKGIYKDKKEEDINIEMYIQVIWNKQTDINLSQDIEKYNDLENRNILLQQKISTIVDRDYLPREAESLEINVPNIDDKFPSNVKVLFNGVQKDDIKYDNKNGLVFLSINNNGNWGKSINEYKIIYIYEDVEFGNKIIKLDTKLKTKLYTQETVQKEDIQNEVLIKEKGNLISLSKTTTKEIYKGYLYVKDSRDTLFEDQNRIEISKEAEFNVYSEEENFLDEHHNKYNLNNKIYYKQTLINKSQFENILGENGRIIISDGNGMQIAMIDNNTEVNDEGNFEINYDKEINNISFYASKPIKCGVIDILNKKALKSETGYTKDQLRLFNVLNLKTKLVAFNRQEEDEAEVYLLDTKTDAKIEVNNIDLSTLQTNENVQLLVTLISDSEKNDLYKNPQIQILLPKGVKANIKSINQLNCKEELQIVNPSTIENSEGKQLINLKLQGEQNSFENTVTEGVQIAIVADITIDKTLPSRKDKVEMYYTNENREGTILSNSVDINIKSKNGVMAINNIYNYSKNEKEIESIDNDIKIGNLETLVEEINAKQEINIVNNYDSDITDVSIIINNPELNEEKINNEILKANFGLNINQLINKSENIRDIFYLENDNWVEIPNDMSNIRAIKVRLNDNVIKSKNVAKLEYDISIPGELGVNKSTYSNLTLSYTYAGEEYITNSGIVLKTEESNLSNEEPTYETESNGIKIDVIEKSAEGILRENQEVYEGEKIKYIVKLTNNTEETINDIRLEATHQNAIFWNHNEYQVTNSHTFEEETVTKYEENETLQKMLLSLEELKPEETKELEYQITVKNIENENDKLSGNISINNGEYDIKNIEISPRNIKAAKLILLLKDSFDEKIKIYSGGGFPIELSVKNNTDLDMKDVIVELSIPDKVHFTPEEFMETDNLKVIDQQKQTVKFKVGEIKAKETIKFSTQLIVDEIPLEKEKIDSRVLFNINVDGTKYYSNEIERTLYQSETIITAIQTSDKEDEFINDKEEITFITTIENKGSIEKVIDIIDTVPSVAEIEDVFFIRNNKEEKVDISTEYNQVFNSLKIEPNELIKLVVKTKINMEKAYDNEFKNFVVVKGLNVYIKTNEIKFKIKKENNDPNNDDPKKDNPDSPNNSSIDNHDSKSNKYSISGQVWLDTNKNGKLDNNENNLNNIEVILLNSDTGNIAKNENQQDLSTKIGNDGTYKFENIEVGQYIVVFKYNNNRYRITEYKAQGVFENENSDVVSKNITINGENINAAITETLSLKEKDIENINAGFIENEKFDLRLDKYINKIIIQNSKGTVVNQYDNAKLAKIEIDSKQLANSTVIIEYLIQVTNEGEFSGYASEIVDYMPSDLNFSSEMNNNWYQTTNGEVLSKELENTIINPGENKQVILTLAKRMNQNNTGTTINTAEIKKSNNDLSIKDNDSIAGNNASGEDDISTAQVIISIRTGGIITYIALTVSLVLIIGIGVYYIKKKVILE